MPETVSARSRLSKTGSAGGLAAGGFRRAGPRPVFGASHQPRVNWIRLDIRNHRSQFFVGSNPAVEILTLPKGLPFPACDAVRANGCGGFHPSHNLGKFCMRLHDNVNMIGHDHPREQIVTLPNPFAIKKRLHKTVGNIRVSQPSRTIACAIQLPIVQRESSPHVGISDEKCWLGLGKGACQPPCEEDDSVLGDPVRKSSVPEHNSPRTGGKTAGAPVGRTGLTLTNCVARTGFTLTNAARYRHGVLASVNSHEYL
jgi:hypothetical protein